MARGYEHEVLIKWGDLVVPGAPEFDFENQTAAAQAMQFGFNNDFCGLVEMPGRRNRWFMVNNHEYASEPFMFHGYDADNPTREQFEIGLAAHGLSVVVVEKNRRGHLEVVMDPTYNRQITLNTPFTVRGPAAGSDLLKTSADRTGTVVLGTMNNCSGGLTPWGTILSGEENVHQYSGNADAVTDPVARERLARYGFPAEASDREWERFERRVDLAQDPNEANRFGWIVEIDPADPGQPAQVHRARPVQTRGRERHRGEGRPVQARRQPPRTRAQQGSARLGRGVRREVHWREPAGEIDGSGTLPSDGEFDGTGEWIPLAHNKKSFVDGCTAGEVYVFTRMAADAVGATKMDRPEDVEPGLSRAGCTRR